MTLQARAAQVDITPESAVPLFGYPHVRRISTGVHDPLLASALVLRSRGVTQAQIALGRRCSHATATIRWTPAILKSAYSRSATVQIGGWRHWRRSIPCIPRYCTRIPRSSRRTSLSTQEKRYAKVLAEMLWSFITMVRRATKVPATMYGSRLFPKPNGWNPTRSNAQPRAAAMISFRTCEPRHAVISSPRPLTFSRRAWTCPA